MKLSQNNSTEQLIVDYWSQNIQEIIKTAKNGSPYKDAGGKKQASYEKSLETLSKINIQTFIDRNKSKKIRLSIVNNMLIPSCDRFLTKEKDFRFLGILHCFSHLDTKLRFSGIESYNNKSHFLTDFLFYYPYSKDEISLYFYLLYHQVNFLFSREYSVANLKKAKNKNGLARELILLIFCSLFVFEVSKNQELLNKIKSKFQDRWQYLEITELNFNLFNTYLLDALQMLEKNLAENYEKSGTKKIQENLKVNKFTQEFGDILFSDKLELEKMSQISSFVLKSVIPLLE